MPAITKQNPPRATDPSLVTFPAAQTVVRKFGTRISRMRIVQGLGRAPGGTQ